MSGDISSWFEFGTEIKKKAAGLKNYIPNSYDSALPCENYDIILFSPELIKIYLSYL